MKRITVEQLKVAYQETGLKPATEDYLETRPDNNGQSFNCGCGIGVLAFRELGYAKTSSDEIVSNWADEIYTKPYRLGFVTGFDGKNKIATKMFIKFNNYTEEDEELYLAGYEDGLKANKEFFKEEK